MCARKCGPTPDRHQRYDCLVLPAAWRSASPVVAISISLGPDFNVHSIVGNFEARCPTLLYV
jgi:hypothetical protein